MLSEILINIGSGNGLFSDGTKPFPEPMLTYHQWGIVAFTMSQEILQISVPGIYQSHKSHNAPGPYPTMHHSKQKCTHFCSEWCIVGYGTVALWDLWISQLNRRIEIRCACAALCVDWSRHKKFTILHLNHRSVVSLYFGKQPTFG